VDIPSVIYSFSYEQRADWSRVFAPGAELRDYADHMVDKYGLREKLPYLYLGEGRQLLPRTLQPAN
jgi:cation diffusion facilitator CzcD-associated flavoprotein CzcO